MSSRNMVRTARLVAVPAVVLVVAGACSTATAGGSKPTAPTAMSPSNSTVMRVTAEGGGTPVGATFRVPASTWTHEKGFAVISDAGGAARGVSVWEVGTVAKDPCHSLNHMYDPGPSVANLVSALEVQSTRHASAPKTVMLGGHTATYLTWSVPSDSVVTGDGDFTGCDMQSDGHRDFISWEGVGGVGQRWQQMAGQVDQLWVVDVSGQRVIVDASHSPNTTPAQIAEEDQIVQTVTFVPNS